MADTPGIATVQAYLASGGRETLKAIRREIADHLRVEAQTAQLPAGGRRGPEVIKAFARTGSGKHTVQTGGGQ